MIKNREEYKKIRKSLTDQEVVEFRKERIYSEKGEKILKVSDDKVWNDNIDKLYIVLDKISERSEFDIWERICIRKLCRKEENGYRIKSNQKGIKRWIKSIVEKYSMEMRSDVPVDLSEKTMDVKKEDGEKFWIHYQMDEEEQAKKWKRGVLYKKSIRIDKTISWDIETYHQIWFDKRRVINTERRYMLSKKTWKEDRCDLKHEYIEVYQTQITGGYRTNIREKNRCVLEVEESNNREWCYETCKNKERLSEKYRIEKEWKDNREFHTGGILKNPPIKVKVLIESRHRKGLRWRKEDRWKNIYKGKVWILYREQVKKLPLGKVYKGWSPQRGRIRYNRDKMNMYIKYMLPIRLPIKRERTEKRGGIHVEKKMKKKVFMW